MRNNSICTAGIRSIARCRRRQVGPSVAATPLVCPTSEYGAAAKLSAWSDPRPWHARLRLSLEPGYQPRRSFALPAITGPWRSFLRPDRSARMLTVAVRATFQLSWARGRRERGAAGARHAGSDPSNAAGPEPIADLKRRDCTRSAAPRGCARNTAGVGMRYDT